MSQSIKQPVFTFEEKLKIRVEEIVTSNITQMLNREWHSLRGELVKKMLEEIAVSVIRGEDGNYKINIEVKQCESGGE